MSAVLLRLCCTACNFLQNGDATFSIFACNFWEFALAKNSEEPDRLSIYLFCGKRCDRIKILLREQDGYTLLYKRLDRNVRGRFRWPRNASEVRSITWQQLDWLMTGLEIEQPKALRIAQ